MLIKQKLTLNAIMSISSMIAMLILVIFSSSSLKKDIILVQDIGKVETDILHLRLEGKSFLQYKKQENVESFQKTMTLLETHLIHLTKDLNDINVDTLSTKELTTILNKYQSDFMAIVHMQTTIGLTPKTGLYGKLRAAVHGVEELLGDDDFKITSMMLQLRRNEKDFMLRLDKKYIPTFITNIDKFNVIIEQSNLEGERKTAIDEAMIEYKKTFLELVNTQELLGLDSNSGLQKEMTESLVQMNQTLEDLTIQIRHSAEQYVSTINNITYTTFAFFLLLAFVVAWVIGRNITSSIWNIKQSMLEVVSTNNLTIKVNSKGKDDLADMAESFNHILKTKTLLQRAKAKL